ncbi:MAG: flagellar hook-length control protein FliK [Oscillospiraceae bacterium]|nr:flagellar hook-length control protein FliK [Oscillospiraceae bacterium]
MNVNGAMKTMQGFEAAQGALGVHGGGAAGGNAQLSGQSGEGAEVTFSEFMACLKDYGAKSSQGAQAGEIAANVGECESVTELGETTALEPEMLYSIATELGVDLPINEEFEGLDLSEMAKFPWLLDAKAHGDDADEIDTTSDLSAVVGSAMAAETMATVEAFMAFLADVKSSGVNARTEGSGDSAQLSGVGLTEEGESSQILNVSRGADGNTQAKTDTVAESDVSVNASGGEASQGAAAVVQNEVAVQSAEVGANRGATANVHENAAYERINEVGLTADVAVPQETAVHLIDGSSGSAELSGAGKIVAAVSTSANGDVAGAAAVSAQVSGVSQMSESAQTTAVFAQALSDVQLTDPAKSVNQGVSANVAETVETPQFQTSASAPEVEVFNVAGVLNSPALSGDTAVQKTVAAQVGEAIAAQLIGLSKSDTNGVSAAAQLPQPQVVTAAQVEAAIIANANFDAAAVQSGVSEFKIMLNPEHLGEITVRLLVDGNKMSVFITAASESTRDLLMARMNSVRVMVELSGVTVDKYEVTVTADNVKASYLDSQQRENGHNQENHEQSNDDAEKSEDDVSFAEVVQMMQMMDRQG